MSDVAAREELGAGNGAGKDAGKDVETPVVLILGRDTCEDTMRSRGFLHLQGISSIYRNVELDPEADAWNRSFNGGELVTPVILIGDPDAPSAVLIEPTDEELAAAIRAGTAAGD